MSTRRAPGTPFLLISALALACSNAEDQGPVTYLDAANGPSGDAAVILGGDMTASEPFHDAGPTPTPDAAEPPAPDAAVEPPTPDAAVPPPPADAAVAPTPDAEVPPPPADAAIVLPPDAAEPPPPPVACAPAADPAPAQAQEVSQDGRFVRLPRFGGRFIAARRVTVRLPPGGPRPDERLPVLYVHDGQNVFFDEEATFGVSWGAIATLDDLAADARVDAGRALVVAVDNSPDRIADYTPVVDPEYMEGGDADAYGRFLIEELKPYIDFHFPTRCTPEDTGLLGSSLGGLVSLYLGAQHPEVFGRIAAFSPSLWWADGVAFDWVAPLAAAVAEAPGRRLYLDTGNFEGSPAAGPGSAGRSSVVDDGRHFVDALVAALPEGAQDRVMLVEDPGAEHDEAAWRRRLPNALRFVLGPPLGEATADALWPWAPVMRAGQSTRASILAHDALRDMFSLLGPAEVVATRAPGVVSLGAGGLLSAVAPGTSALTAPAAPALAVDLTVAAANESIVHLLVHVPEGSGPVYAGGSLDRLGPWEATALPLRPLTPTLYEGFLAAPTGEPFEFKFTSGTWDAVEKAANGADVANRRFTPAGDADLELSVLRWGVAP